MTRDRPEIDPRSTRDRPETDPRSTQDWGSTRGHVHGFQSMLIAQGGKGTLDPHTGFLPSADRDRPEIDPRPARAINPTLYSPKPRQPKIDRYRPDSPPRYSTAGGFLSHRVFTLRGPRSTRDRPETGTSDQPNILSPKPPLWGTPPPSPRASVSFASRQWGLGGGVRKTNRGGWGGGGPF